MYYVLCKNLPYSLFNLLEFPATKLWFLPSLTLDYQRVSSQTTSNMCFYLPPSTNNFVLTFPIQLPSVDSILGLCECLLPVFFLFLRLRYLIYLLDKTLVSTLQICIQCLPCPLCRTMRLPYMSQGQLDLKLYAETHTAPAVQYHYLEWKIRYVDFASQKHAWWLVFPASAVIRLCVWSIQGKTVPGLY